MNTVEHGYCDYCGAEGIVRRKYYYYDIDCNCCVGKHFEMLRYCDKCSPTPPLNVIVTMKPMEDSND